MSMKRRILCCDRPISSLGRSRRSFVQGLPVGLAGLALGGGLWSRLLGRALAQENAAQRLLVWYTADGTVPEWFWGDRAGALNIRNDRTTDLSGSDFNDSVADDERPTFILQPLAAYADRITLVRGVSNPGQGDHTPAVRSMFTGEALAGEQDEGSTPSLDTLVSEVLTNDTHAAPILRTGVYGNRVSYGGTRDLSRTDNGFIEPSWQPTSDARQVLDAVGGAVGAEPEPSNPGAPANASRLAILGHVKSRVEAVRCAAGSAAAQRLDAYVEEVARLERLETEMRPAPSTGEGVPTLDPEDGSYADAERDIRSLPTIAPFVRDLAVTSLALNYAPVTTIQWGASGENKIEGGELTDYRYDFLPDLEYPGAGDHGLAHPEDGAFEEAGHRITAAVSTRDRVRIFRWFFGQLQSMLDRMAQIPDGAGTLLDNTTILCVSEFGGPNANSTAAQHSTENLPYVLISGPNSPFKTGQYFDVERTHGDYLLTIARAFGSSVDRMGVGDSTIDEILK